GASLNIRHNLSSSKGPKPLQLKLLTTYIPKTSAFTLAFSTSQRLRTTRASARTFFTFRHYITPSMKMLTMTNLSTECLIQLTKLGYDATPFNQILKQNAKREMRLRLGKVTVADVLAAQ